MSSIHTLQPSFRVPGFFTKENVSTISRLVTETIAKSYTARKVIVPDSHIVRFMQIVQEERPESVAKMNQRVVMDLVRSFLNHVEEQERANNWAYHRWDAYNWGANLGIRPYEKPKLRGKRVGKNDARGFRFHFTY